MLRQVPRAANGAEGRALGDRSRGLHDEALPNLMRKVIAHALRGSMSTEQWTPNLRYPDPYVTALDPRFNKYKLPLASVDRLGSGRAGARVRCGSAIRAV